MTKLLNLAIDAATPRIAVVLALLGFFAVLIRANAISGGILFS